MQTEQKQPRRQRMFTDQEIELARNTFKDETILKALRKHFLQLPLNGVEASMLQAGKLC